MKWIFLLSAFFLYSQANVEKGSFKVEINRYIGGDDDFYSYKIYPDSIYIYNVSIYLDIDSVLEYKTDLRDSAYIEILALLPKLLYLEDIFDEGMIGDGFDEIHITLDTNIHSKTTLSRVKYSSKMLNLYKLINTSIANDEYKLFIY